MVGHARAGTGGTSGPAEQTEAFAQDQITRTRGTPGHTNDRLYETSATAHQSKRRSWLAGDTGAGQPVSSPLTCPDHYLGWATV